MAVRETTYDAGPESIPPRARFGFRISRPQGPFALKWKIETWAKPPRVYMQVESQSLFDAIRMMFIARTHKGGE